MDTKVVKAVEEATKEIYRKAVVQGCTQGYLAITGMILEKIDKGYTLEQIKTFCENITKENKK